MELLCCRQYMLHQQYSTGALSDSRFCWFYRRNCNWSAARCASPRPVRWCKSLLGYRWHCICVNGDSLFQWIRHKENPDSRHSLLDAHRTYRSFWLRLPACRCIYPWTEWTIPAFALRVPIQNLVFICLPRKDGRWVGLVTFQTALLIGKGCLAV